MRWAFIAVAAVASSIAAPTVAVQGRVVTVNAAEMFAMADRATARGDHRRVAKLLTAMTRDKDLGIRSEARFRLGKLLAEQNHLAEAALLYRAILDEEGGAQPVRLELASVLERFGDEAGARRILRQAQAGGLPPAVARFVDRWSADLRSRKPFGTSFEMAIAPDSNINHATNSSTLGTVVGDFALDRNARKRSGTGLAMRAQSYARLNLTNQVNLLGRVTGSADLYRRSRFDSFTLGVSAGPEINLGGNRLTAALTAGWRRFGGKLYESTTGATFNYIHNLGRRAQVRAEAGIDRVDNRVNNLEDGRGFSLSLSYERALSNRAGIALNLAGDRRQLRDPGYSTRAGQVTLTGYHEFGAMTLIGSLGVGGLRADERLSIYPHRRVDSLIRASIGAEMRKLTYGGFAPVVRVIVEHNRSNIAIYDYQRVRTEFGLTRAF